MAKDVELMDPQERFGDPLRAGREPLGGCRLGGGDVRAPRRPRRDPEVDQGSGRRPEQAGIQGQNSLELSLQPWRRGAGAEAARSHRPASQPAGTGRSGRSDDRAPRPGGRGDDGQGGGRACAQKEPEVLLHESIGVAENFEIKNDILYCKLRIFDHVKIKDFIEEMLRNNTAIPYPNGTGNLTPMTGASEGTHLVENYKMTSVSLVSDFTDKEEPYENID